MHLIAGGIDIEPLEKAAQSFLSALEEVNSELTRDGAIQRFEYTFELSWKTMRRILRSKGSDVNHPKDVFREAAAEKMISDPVAWFGFLEKRNKATHIYKQEVADEVYRAMPSFKQALLEFLSRIGSIV